VSSVTDMKSIFHSARAFDRTLCGKWKTSKALKSNMFSGSLGKLCA
jgi:hypothetical protein